MNSKEKWIGIKKYTLSRVLREVSEARPGDFKDAYELMQSGIAGYVLSEKKSEEAETDFEARQANAEMRNNLRMISAGVYSLALRSEKFCKVKLEELTEYNLKNEKSLLFFVDELLEDSEFNRLVDRAYSKVSYLLLAR